MTPSLLIGIVVVACVGMLLWLAAVVASIVAALKLPKEHSAAVPTGLWIVWGLAMVSSVVWPVGVVASLVCAGVGMGYAALGPAGTRRFAGLVAGVGVTYLGLCIGLVLTMLVFFDPNYVP